MRLFLDSCVIIYWIEMAEPFYSQLMQSLQEINKKYPNAELAVSSLSILECCVAPLQKKDRKILNLYYDFFNNPDLTMIQIERSVIEKATQLRADLKLTTPDALQASCALTLDPVVFISNDKVFGRIPTLNVALI